MRTFLLKFFVLLSLFSGGFSPAFAEEAAAKTAASTPSVEPAELSYLNRPIVTFRASLLGVPPSDRVRSAIARLDAQAERGSALVLTVKPSVVGQMVQLDDVTIFFITPGDVDPLSNETLEKATAQVMARFERVAVEMREIRDGPALWMGFGRAAIATLIAVGLLRLIHWLRHLVRRRLVRRTAALVQRVRIGNVTLMHRERALAVIHFILTAVMTFFYVLVAYEWFSVVLAQFPFTRPWGEQLNGFLFGMVRHLVMGVVDAVPGLMTAAIIFFIARSVTRGLASFFTRIEEGEVKFDWIDADLAYPTRRITVLLVWLFAIAMAYPYLPGSQTEAFKGMSVLIGLMVTMGASSLVGQAFSGLILTYGRVYRRGEFVRIGEYEGTVTNVGTFTTRIRTGMGEELTLSNATILSGTTANYSRAISGEGKAKGFVVDAKVTIGYDTPWRQVHAMLILAAHRTPGVLAEPKAQVYQTALSDWYPEYRLVCHASPGGADSRANVISALHANIQDTFNEFGVQIMSPQYFEDPAQAKIVPPENWYAAPAEPPAAELARDPVAPSAVPSAR